MTRTDNAPVIIRRKKIVVAAGHHGGAWKVAYADFVTAMMAFFLMMWLLNATTEDQRQGLADYFSPEIPMSQESGGSRYMLAGNSVSTSDDLSGTAVETEAETELLRDLAERFEAESGESEVADRLLRHVKTRVTDEGLVVDIFSLPGAPIFETDDVTPTPLLRELIAVVDDTFRVATNDVAIHGHVRANPVVRQDSDPWATSQARAEVTRSLLASGWTGEPRLARVASFADNTPLHPDRMDLRNDRVELILLRTGGR